MFHFSLPFHFLFLSSFRTASFLHSFSSAYITQIIFRDQSRIRGNIRFVHVYYIYYYTYVFRHKIYIYIYIFLRVLSNIIRVLRIVLYYSRRVSALCHPLARNTYTEPFGPQFYRFEIERFHPFPREHYTPPRHYDLVTIAVCASRCCLDFRFQNEHRIIWNSTVYCSYINRKKNIFVFVFKHVSDAC